MEKAANASAESAHGRLLEESREFEGAMGVVAWATLEMCRQGGMPAEEREALHRSMMRYFTEPTDEVCNRILSVVETRLETHRMAEGNWYT
jgi:hypothetical protein